MRAPPEGGLEGEAQGQAHEPGLDALELHRERSSLPERPRVGSRVARRAAAAEAEDLVAVALDHEADLLRRLVLQALDLRARELEDVAAGLADEVVVVGPLVVGLEAALPVEGQLAREPRLLQQLQGAVDGGAADVGPALLHEGQEVVHGEVLLRPQEGVEDHLALLAALQVVLAR